MPDYIGSGGKVNAIFARLVRTLGAGGHGPPTLRFGGNSTDETWWNPAGAPRPVTITTDVTPDWLAQLGNWERATRTPLVLGLNLGLADAANAAASRRRRSRPCRPAASTPSRSATSPIATPSRSPSTWRAVALARVQKRADTYEYPQYRSELGAYAAAVGPVAPGIALSAGGFASTSWEDHEDDLLSNSWLPVFSTHAYALPTCGAAARRRSSRYYTARLLSGRTYQPLVSRAAQLSAVATAHGAAVRVSEANTAICGGVHKGSDTFAAALWGTDVLFGMAEAGVRNVDLHTWTGAWYAPVDFVRVRGRTVGRVRPLFYAMLLFDRATPRGARLLPVGPNAPNAQLKTWATVDAAGTRRVVVVNKDAKRPHKVVLRVPGGGRPRPRRAPRGPVGRRDARRDLRRAGLRAADARRQAARQARRGAGRPQVWRVPRAHAGGQRRAGDGADALARRLGVVGDDGAPAVDRHGRAGDEARLVGEQVGDRGGDLLGSPGAADRVQTGELALDARRRPPAAARRTPRGSAT